MRKKATNKQKAYIADYNKANYKSITFRLHKTIEKDLIDYLSTKSNTNGYLKDLIRQDMKSCRSYYTITEHDYKYGDIELEDENGILKFWTVQAAEELIADHQIEATIWKVTTDEEGNIINREQL